MPTPQTNDPRVLSKRTSNALDRLQEVEKRIEEIEKKIPALVSEINNALGGMSQQLSAQGEVLEAVVSLLGEETVQNTIKESRERKASEASEAEKKALEELKNTGAIAVVNSISDKSIIVGREFNADGNLRPPGRAQVAFARVDPAFKEKLLGAAVGFVMDLPTGGKFQVDEIYEVVQKAESVQAPSAPETATEGE